MINIFDENKVSPKSLPTILLVVFFQYYDDILKSATCQGKGDLLFTYDGEVRTLLQMLCHSMLELSSYFETSQSIKLKGSKKQFLKTWRNRSVWCGQVSLEFEISTGGLIFFQIDVLNVEIMTKPSLKSQCQEEALKSGARDV